MAGIFCCYRDTLRGQKGNLSPLKTSCPLYLYCYLFKLLYRPLSNTILTLPTSLDFIFIVTQKYIVIMTHYAVHDTFKTTYVIMMTHHMVLETFKTNTI